MGPPKNTTTSVIQERKSKSKMEDKVSFTEVYLNLKKLVKMRVGKILVQMTIIQQKMASSLDEQKRQTPFGMFTCLRG